LRGDDCFERFHAARVISDRSIRQRRLRPVPLPPKKGKRTPRCSLPPQNDPQNKDGIRRFGAPGQMQTMTVPTSMVLTCRVEELSTASAADVGACSIDLKAGYLHYPRPLIDLSTQISVELSGRH